jgi:hypothetical protein
MFVTWFSSQFAHGEVALEWAKGFGPSTIDPTVIQQKASDDEWHDLERINAQLQVALVSLCRDEALTVVRNSAKGQGLDAWRRLCREYEPTTDQANLRLLKKVLQPRQQTIDTLRSSMETWEREYREYHDRTGDELSDAVLRLTLQAMCPKALQEHLEFHSARLTSYKLLKSEIDAYLEIKMAASSSGAVPMEIDALTHKGKGKGKGKGKSSDNRKGTNSDARSNLCQHCNRTLSQVHTEWDCWYNPKNKSPEAVAKRAAKSKGKAAGKSPANKGRGKGPKGGVVRSLEEQTWPQDQNQGDSEQVSTLFALEEGSKSNSQDSWKVGSHRSPPARRTRCMRSWKVGPHRSPPAEAANIDDREVGSHRPPPVNEQKKKDYSTHSRVAGRHQTQEADSQAMSTSSSSRASRSTTAAFRGMVATVLRNHVGADLRHLKSRSADDDVVDSVKHQAQQLDVKRQSRGHETDARFQHDIASGKPWKLAMTKYKARCRAAARRHSEQSQRAAERIELDNKWHAQFDDPHRGTRAEDLFEDEHKVRIYEGDEDLDEKLVRKPFTAHELRSHRQERHFKTDVVQSRSWERPLWRKRRTTTSKDAHNQREAKRRKVKRTAKPKGLALQRAVMATARPKSLARAKALAAEEEATRARAEDPFFDLDALGHELAPLQQQGARDDADKEHWQRVDFTVDSGASVSCIPSEMVNPGCVTPCASGPSSYTSASNHKVEAIGQISPVLYFQNGVQGSVQLTVLQGLKKPLFSVARMVHAGYEVHLGGSRAYAVHLASGACYRIYERGGVYVMPVWIKRSFLCSGRAQQ